jgi:hypothetical protein
VALKTAEDVLIDMAQLLYQTIERLIALEKQVKELQSGK